MCVHEHHDVNSGWHWVDLESAHENNMVFLIGFDYVKAVGERARQTTPLLPTYTIDNMHANMKGGVSTPRQVQHGSCSRFDNRLLSKLLHG